MYLTCKENNEIIYLLIMRLLLQQKDSKQADGFPGKRLPSNITEVKLMER